MSIFCELSMKYDKILVDKLTSNNVEIPKHTFGALVRYLVHGALPGSFLECMLTKNVYAACFKADFENKKHIADIMKCIEFNFPQESWGSNEKVMGWVKLSDDERKKILEDKRYLNSVIDILSTDNPEKLKVEVYD